MSREEEIKEAAEMYSAYIDATDEEDLYNSTELEAFKDGAEWADNHPEKKQKATISLWVARDKNGLLYLYENKPMKFSTTFDEHNGFCVELLNSDLFPEVKWEDEEPTEIELVIKK